MFVDGELERFWLEMEKKIDKNRLQEVEHFLEKLERDFFVKLNKNVSSNAKILEKLEENGKNDLTWIQSNSHLVDYL